MQVLLGYFYLIDLDLNSSTRAIAWNRVNKYLSPISLSHTLEEKIIHKNNDICFTVTHFRRKNNPQK